MGNVLRLAIVDPNDISREALKNMLLGLDTVWLEAECSRYEFFTDVVGQSRPDVGIICLDENPDKAIRLVENLREIAECSVVVVSSSNDGDLILRSMRAGAKEFLTQPLTVDELLAAFERIGQQRAGGGGAKNRGCCCIAVAGAGGGVGSTSVAVNLGCALAADEANSVALVDLDMSLGDADVFLDTIPDYTLADVAQNVSRMDFALLKKSMTKHSSGLYLLPRPVQLQDAPLVAPEDFRRVLGLMKASFSHVLLDLSKAYSPLDMSALEEADHVLLVTQLDLPCLRNVVRLMMSFDEVDGLKDKTKIIVNRVGLDAGQIGLKKAQETIGRDIFWQIPNDYRTMVEVRNNGVPLLEQFPKAGITQAVVSLAAALNGDIATESPTDKNQTGAGWRKFWPVRSGK
ncbi:MAG: AAA family ATPase [Planctomycetales bacterium]|nr:AAA family ATPase [Planctomycetales bacterium]MCA9166981.1 AAA family ATPase [Planctomycetales bacterium]